MLLRRPCEPGRVEAHSMPPNSGDCRSFEPLVQEYVATFLRPGSEVQISTRVLNDETRSR